MHLPQMGYDRAITVFSPDGRLFQVEYAREAVKRGATAIGVKTKEGVLLLADRRVASKLLEVICDFKQQYTQFGGVRPFGVSLLIAGFDSSPRLFETDPSGALLEYKATSIGSGRSIVIEHFENVYRDDMSTDDAVVEAMVAMGKAIEGELSEDGVELVIITGEGAFLLIPTLQETSKKGKTLTSRNCWQ